MVIAAVGGLLLGLVLAFGRELFLQQRARYPGDFAELSRLWRRRVPGRAGGRVGGTTVRDVPEHVN